MRNLKTNDIFKMSRILTKLNLKPDLDLGEDEMWDEKLFVMIIQKIGENLHLAQNEVNDFLGDLCGMTGEDFGNLDIEKALEYIKEFKSLPGITGFFKTAGRWMNRPSQTSSSSDTEA